MKHVFIPFGDGPRICPGMKFGLAQSKAGIVTLIKSFHVSLSKNCKPLEICTKSFIHYTKNPILFNFRPKCEKNVKLI